MTAALPERVTLVEVGPRDGLQNESAFVPTDVKVALIETLVAAGLTHIEATSFVHPKAIPQLADAVEVAGRLPRHPGVTFSALVPNQTGLERAIAAGMKRIAVFTAASESFTQRNIRMSIDESLATFEPVVREALDRGMSVRGYVSTCFVCPFEGEIDPARVLDVARRLLTMGVDQVAISDTIGAAAPTDVERLLGVLLRETPVERIALHFHDTYGTALANIVAGLRLGVTCFDASVGGLGGCPYAPGASGNVATEDVVYLLERMGVHTGVSIEKLREAGSIVAKHLGRELNSRQARLCLTGAVRSGTVSS